MTRKLRYTAAGLLLSPVFALAQAPIVPLESNSPILKLVAGQAPAPMPTPMPTPKAAAVAVPTTPPAATPAKMPMPMSTTPSTLPSSLPAPTTPIGSVPSTLPSIPTAMPSTPVVSGPIVSGPIPSAPVMSAPQAVPAPSIVMPEAAPAAEAAPEEAKPEEKFLLQKLVEASPAGKSLADNGWKIYGWTQGSYNASSASRNNLPVPFIDRANEFSLNQNWLHVEKAVDTTKKEYQWGLGADIILPGTDARTTYARGMFDGQNASGVLYGFDLFQAYIDIFSPNVGPSGTTFRLGKFATFLEYEVVQGISNPFISRSYLFQYNPFTHTGGLAITPLNDDWTMSNGLVLGNDNFIDPTARLTYVGQLKWAPKDGKTTVAFGTSVTNPRYNASEAFNYYNVYNLQVTHKLSDKATYVLDASYSHQDKITGVGSADWYGFVNYLLYQATDKLAWNNRVELFNDSKGVRTGGEGLYTAVTTGLTWKPMPWLYVMPEVRYDYATSRPFEGSHDLFTAAIGAIVRW
jgi:hypothetical protein